MLVLSRKVNEKVLIGDNIEVTVVRIGPHSVRLGITAPGEIPVFRTEILRAAPGEVSEQVERRAEPATA